MSKRFVSRFLKRSFNSRIVFLLVFVNLCVVAHQIGSFPLEDHGAAECVGRRTEEAVSACYPPLPVWEIVILGSNLLPLLGSVFISETIERLFPQLCGLMTFVNLSLAGVGICLQWMMVGRGVDYVVSRMKQARSQRGCGG